MEKLSKKVLCFITTCTMTLSLTNPLLFVAAQEVTNNNINSAIQNISEDVQQSKCNLSSLSVTNQALSPEFSADVLNYTLPELSSTTSSITVKAKAETEGSSVKITYTNYNGDYKRSR